MTRHPRTFLRPVPTMSRMRFASPAATADMIRGNGRLRETAQPRSISVYIFSLLALITGIAQANAITVATPINSAQLTSPFILTASTGTCAAKPAVSMGYSIDDGTTTVVPTSFTATIVASEGKHTLHVKCWGQGVNEDLPLDITVVPTASIAVRSPKAGQIVSSPLSLLATAAVCSSQAVVAMGYSFDNSSATTVVMAQSVQASVVAPPGVHTLHVKAWGGAATGGSSCVTDVPITVLSSNVPTPTFSPAAGTYKSAQSVTLSDATAGAAIYYTTNGTAPSTLSTKYSGAIPVRQSQVIEAVAIAPGYITSGLARADYIIAPPSTGPVVPPNAIAGKSLQALGTWYFSYDAGTPGSAVGATSMVSTPSRSGQTRRFISSYTNAGGERYSVDYAQDTASKNFIYDGWVWIEAGSSLANLEMDSNQVTANGQTVIYGFQCSGYSQTWEYSGAGGKWVHSSEFCNPSAWQTNAWHHVQISYSRDDLGSVTYHSVWLDGTEQVINATVPSSFALGWQVGVVQTQFQIDGIGASGSSVVYLDDLAIYRW